MFERYNEKARRTIFFARYEASQYGSPYIEAEFLLLGLLREDRALSLRFITPHTRAEVLRKEIERHSTHGEKISTAVDLPLSNESKHVLAYAAEESERLGHNFIGTEHLLLGILREEHSFAAMLLQEHGITAGAIREDIAKNPPADRGSHPSHILPLGFFQLVLKVADLEASIDFYTKLGFTPVGDNSPGIAVLENGTCSLRLDQNATADHVLSFLSGDMTPAVSRLQSAGFQFERGSLIRGDGSTTAHLRDPDVNIIALLSRIRC